MENDLEKKGQGNAGRENSVQEKTADVPTGENTAAGEKHQKPTGKVSETWAEDTIADLDDFIESQGIYIRQ